MLINAFGLFFLAILVGSGAALCRSVFISRALILGILRGRPAQDPSTFSESRPVRVESCRSPILRPVTISICRI